MTIQLTYNGSNFNIVVEPSCFTASKTVTAVKGDNVGKERESIVGYFSSLPNAIRKIVQSELSESDEKITLEGYCTRIEEAYTELMLQTGETI